MSTQSLPQPPQFQKLTPNSFAGSAPKAIGTQFIRIKYDLAKSVQTLPEMTHDELLRANTLAGGFSWLEDSSEEVYS